MTSGIYGILNVVTQAWYIGSSINIEDRWYLHRSQLRRGVHYSNRLQDDWLRQPEDDFVFVILESLLPEQSILIEAETRWIAKTKATTRGYNTWIDAKSPRGTKQSPETVERRAAKMRGSNNWKTKLTDDDIIAIRQRAANGDSYADISRDYPVGVDAIKSIVYGHNWKHVGGTAPVPRSIDGSHHPNALLDEQKVAEIKQRLCDGEKHYAIAISYDVSREVVSAIARGKSWDHVPWPCTYQKRHSLSESDVAEIRRLLAEGQTCVAIAKKFNVNPSHINRIKNGKTRRSPVSG